MGYPGTKVWTGCMAAPSVCVTSGLCHNLCVPLLYIAEGLEDRSKAGGTLHHVPCAALASATASGGGAASSGYARVGSQWMSRTVDFVTLTFTQELCDILYVIGLT